MAGHSKWANIKHRKAAQDAKKSKYFTRVAKEITVAAKLGGGDPDMNARLRLALEKAKEVNLPKDNVERAIKRGTGELEGVSYEDIRYEGYGVGGFAIIVDTLTDNRNRTVSDVRSTFTKRGGNMGEAGSVSWMFDRIGLLVFGEGADYEVLADTAIENGADDIEKEDDYTLIYTSPDSYEQVKNALAENGFEPESSELSLKPQNKITLSGSELKQALALIDALEDLDDVQAVYANLDYDTAELGSE